MTIASENEKLNAEIANLQEQCRLLREEICKIEDDDLMDADQVADLLKTPVGTIYQWTHQKKIPFQKAGGKLLFSRQELKRWRKENV